MWLKQHKMQCLQQLEGTLAASNLLIVQCGMRPAAFWHFDNMGYGLNILKVPRTQTMLTHVVHIVCHWMAARHWASLLAEAVDTWRSAVRVQGTGRYHV